MTVTPRTCARRLPRRRRAAQRPPLERWLLDSVLAELHNGLLRPIAKAIVAARGPCLIRVAQAGEVGIIVLIANERQTRELTYAFPKSLVGVTRLRARSRCRAPFVLGGYGVGRRFIVADERGAAGLLHGGVLKAHQDSHGGQCDEGS